MDKLGLIGERATARATYLVHVSRLLGKPGREVVKGDSSTGKSFASECALKAAAPEGTFVRTQTSPLALFYSEESFENKTIVFFEANKLGDDEDPLSSVLRTLLSEGKLAYEVTDPRTHSTKYLEKAGPVAFITTTCRAKLDPEIETRILSLHSNGSDEQTKAVVRAIIEGADDTPPTPNLEEWHELDRWLRDGPHDVVIPWAKALASFEISGPPRLRRDIQNLLSLVRAHALLHRATRHTDARDRIVATLDDYEVVVGLLAEAMAVATDKAVRQGTREVVEAVVALRENDPEKKISMRAAQREAGRSSSTTHTDVHDALDRGYLVNRSESSNRFDLDVGDPLPKQEELLPTREELEIRVEEMFGGVREVFGTRPNTQSRSQSQETASVRSVRSNPDQADEIADFEQRLEEKRRGSG